MAAAIEIPQHGTLAIKKETSWGTGVNPSTGDMLPYLEFNPRDVYEEILDEGKRNLDSKVLASYQGAGHSELELSGQWYPSNCGYILDMIMGGYSVSGGADPYTHTFSVGDVIGTNKSLTVEEDNRPTGQARRWVGCRVIDLEINWNGAEGNLTYRANMRGKLGSIVTAQAVTDTTGTTGKPFSGWMMSATLGGSAITRIVSGTWKFSREVEIVHGMANSQDATGIYLGPIDVTADFVFDESASLDTDPDYLLYTAYTQNALVTQFQYGTPAAAGYKLFQITATAFSYAREPMELVRGAASYTYNIHGRGIYNATDGGPCKIVYHNAKTTYAS